MFVIGPLNMEKLKHCTTMLSSVFCTNSISYDKHFTTYFIHIMSRDIKWKKKKKTYFIHGTPSFINVLFPKHSISSRIRHSTDVFWTSSYLSLPYWKEIRNENKRIMIVQRETIIINIIPSPSPRQKNIELFNVIGHVTTSKPM